MKNGKLKKALALILSVSMMSSVLALGSFSAGAVEEVTTVKNDYVPSEDTDTYRAYFYMPEDWYNEYTDTAGAYWWEGTDACPTWQDMYSMNSTDTENIYYMDIPTNAPRIIFNNYIDNGEDPDAPVYNKAAHTIDILFATEEYGGETWAYFPDMGSIEADSELYPEGLKTFDNMIYVIDPNRIDINVLNQKKVCKGEWYYYYGNGEYGFTPEKGDVVYTDEYKSIEDAIADKFSPSTEPTETESTTETTEVLVTTEPEEPDVTQFVTTEPEESDFTQFVTTEPSEDQSMITTYPTYESSTDMGDYTVPNTTLSVDETYPVVVNTTKIYFDIESTGWKNYKNVYCHIWRADGTGNWTSWQTRKELCIKEADGRYSYDTAKTGNEIKKTDGNLYCVIFSVDTGMQTYNTIMSGSCLGDTCYLTGERVENPEDSEKTAQVAAWKNNFDCGPQKVISSTGKVIGTALAERTTNASLLADYLLKYYLDTAKLEKTESLLDQLGVYAGDVLIEVKYKEDAAVETGVKSYEEVQIEIKKIEEVLTPFMIPDYTKVTIPDSTIPEPTTPEPTLPSTPLPTIPEVDTDEPVVENAKIYFDVENAGWENYENIYCHIWRADGTGNWTSWQTRKELCVKEDDGTYSYDLSKTGNDFRYTDGKIYCVIFSADTGARTYNMIMSGSCIGDTVYVTGNTFEYPEFSEIFCIETAWRKNPDCGSQKVITLTGDVIGTAYSEGVTDETLLADYLIEYCYDDAQMEKVQGIFDILGAAPEDVLYEVAVKENYAVYRGTKSQASAVEEYNYISCVLESIFVSEGVRNDIDGNGYTDVKDVTALQMYLANYGIEIKAENLDVNEDGRTDVADVTALQMLLAGYVF